MLLSGIIAHSHYQSPDDCMFVIKTLETFNFGGEDMTDVLLTHAHQLVLPYLSDGNLAVREAALFCCASIAKKSVKNGNSSEKLAEVVFFIMRLVTSDPNDIMRLKALMYVMH